jgi:hypothetical protein
MQAAAVTHAKRDTNDPGSYVDEVENKVLSHAGRGSGQVRGVRRIQRRALNSFGELRSRLRGVASYR